MGTFHGYSFVCIQNLDYSENKLDLVDISIPHKYFPDFKLISHHTHTHTHTQISPRHRNSTTSYQRQSVSTFSVATSASGMPVLDSEPVDRKRSVALREVGPTHSLSFIQRLKRIIKIK